MGLVLRYNDDQTGNALAMGAVAGGGATEIRERVGIIMAQQRALIETEDVPLKRHFPDPTSEMLASPEFEAVWQCIKTWDINVPDVYVGYCGATGNHVRAILDALAAVHR